MRSNGSIIGKLNAPTLDVAKGVWDLQTVQQYRSENKWPKVSADEYWANVVLLLHCDGADESTTFTDMSSLAHTITVGSGAAVDTGLSKFGGGSLLTATAAGHLTITTQGSEFSFGTATDFTIEFWYNGGTSTTGLIGNVDRNLNLFLFSGVYFSNGATNVVNGQSFSSTAGNWRHMAITRSGDSWKLFYNGVTQATYTGSSVSMGGTSNLYIGYDAVFGVAAANYDDIRITKGVARYTADFTPHTVAHPDA